MKNIRKITRIMLTALIAASLAFTASSCKKDSSSTTATSTVTEADAAELTTDAVIPTTGGMITQENSSVNIYKSVALSCGVTKDSTLSGASVAGVVPSYNYNLSWNYELNCTGIVPNTLVFNFSGSSNYNGARMSSTDNSIGGFTLSGFSSSQYSLSSNYTRKGTTISKIGAQNTFNSVITIKSTNLLVDKSIRQIASGTAAVSITATSTSGKSFTFNGTLTFLGSQKGTLVLNSGASYTIQW